MTGPQFARLQEALLSAFPRPADLRQMLYLGMDVHLDVVAGGNNYQEVVFNLIQWAESRGRVAELVKAAREANPGNRTLRAAELDIAPSNVDAAPPRVAPSVPTGSWSGEPTGSFSSGPSGSREPRSTPENLAVRRPPSISWLHLTDLHFGQKHQDWLWPNVREEFLDDLARLHQKAGPWDLVLFSGDLAYSGTEYAGFDAAMAEVWDHFRSLGSDPVLLAVPGNHDVQWPDPKAPAYRALRQWHDDEELREIFWANTENDYRRLIDGAFAGYAKWWEGRDLPAGVQVNPGHLPGDFAATVEKNGVRLGIAGLNSGFLQLGKGVREGALDLDPRQLHAACGDVGKWARLHHANLLMTHHPPEWLHPNARKALRSEIAPAGRFLLHLYGHMHEPRAQAERFGGSPTSRHLQGASLFGLETWEDADGKLVQRIHGYSAGRLTLESDTQGKLSIWPRVLQEMQSGRRKMVPDHSFDLEDEAYSDTVAVRSLPRT